MRKIVNNNKGFTLIELMIVVVIIGILAAIAIPRFTQVSNSAKEAEAGPILKQMCSLADASRMRTGAYPTDLAALEAAGFEDPGAEYYTFAWDGATGIASTAVTAAGTGLDTPTLDCDA